MNAIHTPRSVFVLHVSDSQEERKEVAQLCRTLRKHGVDADVDLYSFNYDDKPRERFYSDKLQSADVTVFLWNEAFRAAYNGGVDTAEEHQYLCTVRTAVDQSLASERGLNRRFVSVVLPNTDPACVPDSLRPYPVFKLSKDYPDLLERLLGRPVERPPATSTPEEPSANLEQLLERTVVCPPATSTPEEPSANRELAYQLAYDCNRDDQRLKILTAYQTFLDNRLPQALPFCIVHGHRLQMPSEFIDLIPALLERHYQIRPKLKQLIWPRSCQDDASLLEKLRQQLQMKAAPRQDSATGPQPSSLTNDPTKYIFYLALTEHCRPDLLHCLPKLFHDWEQEKLPELVIISATYVDTPISSRLKQWKRWQWQRQIRSVFKDLTSTPQFVDTDPLASIRPDEISKWADSPNVTETFKQRHKQFRTEFCTRTEPVSMTDFSTQVLQFLEVDSKRTQPKHDELL